MNFNSKMDVSEIFNLLVRGREADRDASISALDDLDQSDRARLGVLICDALSRDFYPKKKIREDDSVVWTRAWLLSALGRICNDDVKAAKVVRKQLNIDNEPNPWVRYWTLEGLIEAKASDLEKLSRRIIKNLEEKDFVRMLAVAVLASKEDDKSIEKIKKGLKESKSQWATLRALRIVPVPDTMESLCEIVDQGKPSNETYNAIIALGKAPSTKREAESAAWTLAKFITNYRRSPLRDGMRIQALKALGNLKVESIAPILIEALTYDNPALVREAARALRKVLGIRTATARIVEAVSKTGQYHIDGFADALRWMNRGSVVEEELEATMVSGPTDRQEAARILLSKIGGMEAFQKLRARTTATAQYIKLLEKTEEKIRSQFETSIREARSGFKLATFMDMIVFFLGIGLVVVSAAFALFKGGTLESWVGVGLPGGTGVLGILYGILIAKPRRRVRKAVYYLMYLKIIFLAYLHQLHQIDQAYTRCMLEDEPLTSQEVSEFTEMVMDTMLTAVEQLTSSEVSNKAKND